MAQVSSHCHTVFVIHVLECDKLIEAWCGLSKALKLAVAAASAPAAYDDEVLCDILG